MAKKSSGFIGTFGGNPKNRMSNVLAGDRTGRGPSPGAPSTVRNIGKLQNPQFGSPVTRMSAYAQRKDQPKVKSMPNATGEESVRAKQRLTSLAGGLGMQGFGNPKTGLNIRTPRSATMKTRNYQYGEVMGAPVSKAPPKAKTPAAVVRTTTDMKTSPAKAKAPARMAVNPRTGSTLGFMTGKTTGSTATKSGIAGKTTPASRAATQARDKGFVSSPAKTAAGKNVSAGFKSLGDAGRKIASSFGFGKGKPSPSRSTGGRNLSGKP